MNNEAMQLFGFDNESFYMASDSDLKGKVSENADDFIRQDKFVITNKTKLNVLDINYFGSFGLSLFRTVKQPLFDEKNTFLGILVQCLEIRHHGIIRSLIEINKFDIKTYDKISSYYNDNNRLEHLTKKEKLILFFLVRGKSIKDIAYITYNSKRTIETHITNIKNKLKVPNLTSIIEFVIHEDFLKYIPEEIIGSFNPF
jgi:DNA-binding CsgD family transcriptional regulator